MKGKKVILCILDGLGIAEPGPDNPLTELTAPFLTDVMRNCLQLNASGEAVGLMDGQIGNSEVGHIAIGAGRIIEQSLLTINNSFKDKSFFSKQNFEDLVKYLESFNERDLHIIGLLSDGGVHSHINHLINILEYLCIVLPSFKYSGTINLHIVTDGRDVAPRSAMKYIDKISSLISKIREKNINIMIATISGRYYAMDRDQRLIRTKNAFDAIISVKTNNIFTDNNIEELVEKFYNSNINDEFFPSSCNEIYSGISKSDAVLMINFRADRMRQIADMIENNGGIFGPLISTWEYFDDGRVTIFNPIKPIFNKKFITENLGEVLSENGKKQLRIAETEKYAHVTFFLNCGREEPYHNEDRIMVQSPQVATYDLAPEMSANEITDKLLKIIPKQSYDFICVNFANADMVGHTGNFFAAKEACYALDKNLQKIKDAAIDSDYVLIITADHGNIEKMSDDENKQPHTAHTTNLVPFICISDNMEIEYTSEKENLGLSDVAPTILSFMGIPVPDAMTGKVIAKLKK